MSVEFEWSDSYSVGNGLVDSQHKKMFKMVNTLSNNITAREISSLIMELYKYTRYHFSAEEQLMKDEDFEDLVEHKRYHENLISDLNEISIQKFDDEKIIHEFKKFFYNWLIDHIMHKDKKFFDFVNK